MVTQLILAGILLILSVISFLFSVSKKKMGMMYLALILFFCCVGLSVYTIYQFAWLAVKG